MKLEWWLIRASAIGAAVGLALPEQPRSMLVSLAILTAVQADHEARS